MERIVTDAKIMHGKPVIRGTRVPVDVILGSPVGGMEYEEYRRRVRSYQGRYPCRHRIRCQTCDGRGSATVEDEGMRFLVDADSPRLSIEILKKHSHDAVHVRDVLLPSAADGRILEHARKTERIVVSKDLGFAHDLIKDWSFPTSRWLDTIA